MELPGRLAEFVESIAGPISNCDRTESGASRVTWLIETAQTPCVLRQDTGDGPVADTPLTLAREACVYRGLADTPVRIPGLLGETEDALLMERAAGRDGLEGLSEDAVAGVIDSYVDALATLHLETVDERFAPLSPPASAADAATANLSLWAGILASRVRRACPLATFATQWLKAHAPRNAERLTVCHGDVGPGNFMHDDQEVTAMLDWEFVHVGDPMDDLAWLAFRGHHFRGGIGDFESQLARWQEKTGFEVDRRRIAYYRIMVMYIWLVSCLAALDNGAKNLNRFTYLNLITLMNMIMPRAMMEYRGIEMPEIDVNLEPDFTELDENIDALSGLIGITWPDTDPGRSMVQFMASEVLNLSKHQADIARQNRAAIEAVTGETGDDESAILDQWIRSHPDAEAETLALLYETGARRASISQALAPVIAKPFLPLT